MSISRESWAKRKRQGIFWIYFKQIYSVYIKLFGFRCAWAFLTYRSVIGLVSSCHLHWSIIIITSTRPSKSIPWGLRAHSDVSNLDWIDWITAIRTSMILPHHMYIYQSRSSAVNVSVWNKWSIYIYIWTNTILLSQQKTHSKSLEVSSPACPETYWPARATSRRRW